MLTGKKVDIRQLRQERDAKKDKRNSFKEKFQERE